MTKQEFWTRVFAAEGLDEAAVRADAMQRGAALAAARQTEKKRPMPARRPLAALVAAAAVCLFAVGAGAAGGLFKTPAETAAFITHDDLSAFEDEEEYPTLVKIYSAPDVITVNEVQADAGYTVTLLAVANEPAADEAGAAHTHMLYTVARSDGTPLTEAEWGHEIDCEVVIQGCGTAAPYRQSMTTYREQDGVIYADLRVCDLYPFADRELYLIVRQAWGFAGRFGYHAGDDGRITAVADYENLNLLFTLPIGAEHADAASATRAEEGWHYEPTAEEQALLAQVLAQAKARDELNAAVAAQAAGQPLPEPDSAQDTVANNPATLASLKEDMGAWANYTRAGLRAAGETLFTKVCALTLLPGQPAPCYWYESRYGSRIFGLKELDGAPWAVVGAGMEGGAVTEVTILSANADGTVTVEILALPPLEP